LPVRVAMPLCLLMSLPMRLAPVNPHHWSTFS